jgi:hypothetical protein
MISNFAISLFSALAAAAIGVGGIALRQRHYNSIFPVFVMIAPIAVILLTGGAVGALHGKFFRGAIAGFLATVAAVAVLWARIDIGFALTAALLTGICVGALQRNVWWGAAAGLLGAIAGILTAFVLTFE